MSMFPSQDPMLARATIEERHRSADRARRSARDRPVSDLHRSVEWYEKILRIRH